MFLFTRHNQNNTGSSSLCRLDRQVEDYLYYCEYVKGLTRDTVDGKRGDLNLFMTFAQLKYVQDIDNETINQWVAYQKINGCKASTINTRLSRLKSFLEYERDTNVPLPNLKMAFIPKLDEEPARRVWYTREQINQVLCLADRQAWLMIRLTFECGLRLSELVNLQLENLDGRRIHFVGKCRIGADLIMSQETRLRLDDWIKREGITKYLWKSSAWSDGIERPIAKCTARKIMREPFLAAGIEDFYPHSLRHSFATEIILNGASDEEAQHMLRHANAKNTRIYIHELGTRERENFDKFMHCKDDDLR